MSASTSIKRIVPVACPSCGEGLPPGAQYCPGCGRQIMPLKGKPDDSKIGPRTDQPLTAPSTLSETQTDLTSLTEILPDRYQPMKKLGQGGMGAVYLCMDKALERQVAIKIITERYRSDPQSERRFMREARAQATVNHPNVTTVLNFGVSTEGWPFLVMEYLDGQDLRSVIRRDKTIEPLKACDILLQTCEGLQEAHGAGLVHRDLKPSNLMLVRDHRGATWVKILDLGLAKIVGGQTDLKSITIETAGMLIGTPAYMSPEQVAGAPVDGRADIYAMGVVFYEMISGRLPFESESMEGWLYQHLHAAPEAPSAHNPAIAQYPSLDQIALWMLTKQPHERPGSARELATVLKRLIENKLMSMGTRPGSGGMARKSGARAALPFEENPPARKSGPRMALLTDGMPPPPPDVGAPEVKYAATPPAAPTLATPRGTPIDMQQAAGANPTERKAKFLEYSEEAEKAETQRRWEIALECWQRAMAFAENQHETHLRMEACHREVDFEKQLGLAGSAASAGDWEKTDEILTRLNAQRSGDARIETARARLPKRLLGAWLGIARSKVQLLPEGDLRHVLLERLGIAHAQAGDLQGALTLLQDATPRAEARLIGTAHAVIASIQRGHFEGLRLYLDRALAGAGSLSDPSERAQVYLETGRALSAYGDSGAAALAFKNAIAALTEASTKGVPASMQPRRGNTGSLRKLSMDMKTMTVTVTNTGSAKSMRAVWETGVGVVGHAQAEAGLVEDSLASAALIEDPWILAQTLSQISQALARTGRSDEAEKAAARISFALPKTQALRALVVTRIYRGDMEAAEDTLKSIATPEDRIPVLGLLAAAWALRKEKLRAEARVNEAIQCAADVTGARGRFQAFVNAAEPLLNAGRVEIAVPLTTQALKLIELMDDPAARLLSLLQLAKIQESARLAGLPATRTNAFSHEPAAVYLDLLRRALVIWRQVREGPDRLECVERLAQCIGIASAPAMASELIAICRDDAERALIYIGFASAIS